MADTLTITPTQEGQLHILRLAGKLDSETQGHLMDTARKLHEAGARFLLIDLQAVTFIASAGLGALHNVYRLFTPQEEISAWEREKRGEPYKSPYMKLAGASSSVYYVLNIAGFLQNIPIYPDLKSARASFPAGTSR